MVILVVIGGSGCLRWWWMVGDYRSGLSGVLGCEISGGRSFS